MKDLLYYPSFEIKNESWLKFALLYIEKLKPIIPEDGDKYISNYSKCIYEESDLLENYRPRYREAYKASLDAIDIIEQILTNPNLYAPIFHTSQIDKVWKNKELHNYSLFRDKYTDGFEHFLTENNLGTKSAGGVFLSKELAHLYMTIFSHAISDAELFSPITDLPELDRFSIFIRHNNRLDKDRFIVTQKIVQLKLPDKIENISIQKILNLRKRNDFRVKLTAFHKSLNGFLEDDDSDKSETNFINKHKHIYDEFNNELLQLGLGLASFGIGVWISTKSPESNEPEIIKSFLEGGIYLLSGISINQSWKNTKTKRYCRKYLADISKLNK